MNTLLPSSEDERESVAKLDGRFLGIVCWVPMIAFMVLMTFTIIASVRVRHWPYYSNPDPKDLHLPLLHTAAFLSYPLAFFAIPTALLVVISAWKSLRRRDVVVFMIGAGVWAFILPVAGQLLEWLMD